MIHLLMNTPPDAVVGDLSERRLAAMAAAGVPLVDIRRPQEWEETGVIPGSRLLTFFDAWYRYDLDAWLGKFDKVADRDKPFILICRKGIRTRKLGRYLAGRKDFGKVFHLQRGISGWIETGRQVHRLDSE